MGTRSVLSTRISAPDGRVVVKTGVNLTFFSRAAHEVLFPTIVDILPKLLESTGAKGPFFYADKEGESRSLESSDLPEWLAGYRDTKGAEVFFSDRDDECPDMAVHYFGVDPTSPLFSGWPDVASALAVWLPPFLADDGAWAVFESAADQIGEALPFSYGYVSPALNYLGGSAKFPAFRLARPVAFRHPGFDLHDLASTALSIGDAMRGVYWINYLGAKLVASFGGDAALSTRLAHSVAEVTPLGIGVRVRLGEAPEVGDVNRGDRLDAYRKVATVFEPALRCDEIDLPAFSPEDMIRWHERLL